MFCCLQSSREGYRSQWRCGSQPLRQKRQKSSTIFMNVKQRVIHLVAHVVVHVVEHVVVHVRRVGPLQDFFCVFLFGGSNVVFSLSSKF